MRGHDHSHGGHSHGYFPVSTDNKGILTPFIVGIIFNFSFVIVGLIGWIFSGSVAIFGDSLENAIHGTVAGISLLGLYIARRPPNSTMTYGFKRFETLIATVNGVLLFIAGAILIPWGFYRLIAPQEVNGAVMLIVAPLDIIGNGIQLALMKKYSKNFIVKSSMYHLFGDSLMSFGVIISGIFIYFLNFYIADSIAAIMIGGLSAYWAVRILRKTIKVFLQSVPENINFEELKKHIESYKEFYEPHHFHASSVDSEYADFNCHVYVYDPDLRNTDHAFQHLLESLVNDFKIAHPAIQREFGKCTFKSDI
jgi:cobalt-zinc-cadmium efflux system protein